ncbi:hypothetical protein EIN_019470 [Entamoeba invadens IP1]|uniref:hypothetical protein n=1 Tax=Entamoeba invadens IP1 TaxID=370355 RepID=UPI0002C3D50F|nr:hypothetical protein EIN_019470 [Entamoeba invadens IP1]ELP90548.1 hypothetical protein EIN_019470 [Entamoeba invadens IP1]|eukprot:XP_004257319.1 hypothetical protein EIN_019470 [Entamoeba invadens IP1]
MSITQQSDEITNVCIEELVQRENVSPQFKQLVEDYYKTHHGTTEKVVNVAIPEDLLNQMLTEYATRIDLMQLKEGQCYLPFLQGLTGFKQYKLLGEFDGKTLATPNKVFDLIESQKDIMFIITSTDKDIFGSFHHILPVIQGNYVVGDEQMKVFSLLNPEKTPPIYFKARKDNNHLLFFPRPNQKDTVLFFIMNCFEIRMKKSNLETFEIRGTKLSDAFETEMDSFNFANSPFDVMYLRIYQWY